MSDPASASECDRDPTGWACQGLNQFGGLLSGGDEKQGAEHPTYIYEDPYKPISPWAVCPPQPAQNFTPRSLGNRELSETFLSAHSALRDSSGTLVLLDNAQAERADQRITAERMMYNASTGLLTVEGEVRYDEPQMTLNASYGHLWLDENRGEFHDTRFRFYDRHSRGKATRSYLLESGITRYQQASYTTCPDDSNAWMLRGSQVTLDDNTGEGVARNARLSVKGVPVLYMPYLSFPIDDRRKSGFLVPSFSSSDSSGLEISVPYYLNLAPNYDATLTPRYLQDRGVQLNTEFRYLRPNQKGTIVYEYLPNDDLTDTNRTRFILDDKSLFGQHLVTEIKYDSVSDKEYLNDLGDSLSLSSLTHLQRTAMANYNTSWWTLGLRLDDFQTVDPDIAQRNKPYERLPRVSFALRPPLRPFGLEFELQSEFVRFDHAIKVEGDRIDLQPKLDWPLRRDAFEITPRVGLRYTRYKLTNQNPGNPDDPTRTTPIFSLNNVVFFERETMFASKKYLQTLEPQLFYLYVKGENQQDLPLFDTTQPAFSYRQLFAENRFSGADRMGDANQATLAVTTRFIDTDSGAERLRASLGNIFYFNNLNVTLNNTPPETDDHSDFAGELALRTAKAWESRASMVWNPRDQNTERADARIQYRGGFRKIANLSYRYIRPNQNQIDASALWPLSPAWQLLLRWYTDLDDSRTIEKLAGIEYDSCCWGIRLVGRSFAEDEHTTSSSIMLQFVFKGLTRFGSDIESVLEDGILGYTERPLK